MNERIRGFIRAQTQVRWGNVCRMTAGVLLAALLMGPLTELMDAQQQVVNVPTQSTGPGMLITTTTALGSAGTAVIALAQGKAGTSSTDFVTGAHNIYGYAANSGAACFVQIFDRFPAGSITVGTTVPLTSLLVETSSARGFTIYPLPLFAISSALGFASTTTPAGATGCSGTVIEFAYK